MVKDANPDKQLRSVHKVSTPRKDKDKDSSKDKNRGQFLGDAGFCTGRGTAHSSSARDEVMAIDCSPTLPPPAGGVFTGQDMLLQGHRAVESKLFAPGTKIDAHDFRLAAAEKQLAQTKQDRSRSLPHAVALPADSTKGKRPRSSPHSPAEAHPAADDRYQRTLVVNGWTENLARAELVVHGQKLLKQAKDPMVVVRQKYDTRLLLVYATQQHAEAAYSTQGSGRFRFSMASSSSGSPGQTGYLQTSRLHSPIPQAQLHFPVRCQCSTGLTRLPTWHCLLGQADVFFARDHKVFKGRGWSDAWDWQTFLEAASELLCL
eukprot:1679215-Amphidinium_carterae.1